MTATQPTAIEDLNWPLMSNNITREDLDTLVTFLRDDTPILTQSSQVRAFEQEWSEWLGVKYSVLVNSGSSANILTMAALKYLYGPGEVIVPPLTWVSDITSVIFAGLTPVFADISLPTLGLDTEQVLSKITAKTRAVFITHILGYNALTQRLLDELVERGILLIEDVCESHGAMFKGRKLGTFGLASNFSFYYAHHMSTIEGGIICTDDRDLYEMVRMLRSHGMVREATDNQIKQHYADEYPNLNPDFIFAYPGYNMRSTELNAVLGRTQLKRLDANNQIRRENLKLFLSNLDPQKYFTDFEVEGSSNYAFTLVLREANQLLYENVVRTLWAHHIEFRRGTSGGGNQLRQPYLRSYLSQDEYKNYPAVDHVHFYGWYIGNYPDLPQEKILKLCGILNNLAAE